LVFRRTLGAAAALLTAAASLAVAAGTASAATAARGGAAPAPCSTASVIAIDGFAFNPATVARGQSSTATLAAHNCTAQTQVVSETWYGKYIGSGTGVPTGCPVIDPFLRSVSFAPFAAVSTSTTYTTFTGCTASALQITVKLASSSGVALGQATAILNIVPPPSA
jgi:hypothetical protein